jgi:homoaconitase/3-isopropylmalate dehydratase large subunit
VLATQCLVQSRPKAMRILYTGELGFGVTAKDLILGTIGQMGVDGAAGHVVEFAGPVIEGLSMEGRMTVCNMTIEGGGRAGMIAPDQTTLDYLAGRPQSRRRSTSPTCARTTARCSTRRSPSTPRRWGRWSRGARIPRRSPR